MVAIYFCWAASFHRSRTCQHTEAEGFDLLGNIQSANLSRSTLTGSPTSLHLSALVTSSTACSLHSLGLLFNIIHNIIIVVVVVGGKVMFYLTTHSTHFYLRLYGVRHMVKDHSDSEKGNPLPSHRLLFPINSKCSFICTIPQTG